MLVRARVALARSQLRLWHSHAEEELIKREKNETASKHNKGRLRRRIFMTCSTHGSSEPGFVWQKPYSMQKCTETCASQAWRDVQHKAARIQQCLIRADRHYKGRARLAYVFGVRAHVGETHVASSILLSSSASSILFVLRGCLKLMHGQGETDVRSQGGAVGQA